METINKGYLPEGQNRGYGMILQPTMLSVPPPPMPPPPLVLPPPAPYILPRSPLTLINGNQGRKQVLEASNASDQMQSRRRDVPPMVTRASSGILDYGTYKYGVPPHMNTATWIPPYESHGLCGGPAQAPPSPTAVLLPPAESCQSPLAVMRPFDNRPVATPFMQPPDAKIQSPKTEADPQEVEVNVSPGVHIRRTALKLIIDIDFPHAETTEEEKKENSVKMADRNGILNSIQIGKAEIGKLPNAKWDKSVTDEQQEQVIQTSISNQVTQRNQIKIEPPISVQMPNAILEYASPNQMEEPVHLTLSDQIKLGILESPIQASPQNNLSSFSAHPIQLNTASSVPNGLGPPNMPIPMIIQQHFEPPKLQQYAIENSKKQQRLVHDVQVEKRPTSPLPTTPCPSPNKDKSIAFSNVPFRRPDLKEYVMLPPIQITTEQRSVHDVQVEKKPSSPNPILSADSQLKTQRNTAIQTDYHQLKICQTLRTVEPAKPLPEQATSSNDGHGTSIKVMPQQKPSDTASVLLANVSNWPVLGSRSPNKCKSLRKTIPNQLNAIPEALTPAPPPKPIPKVRRQIMTKAPNKVEPSQSKEKPIIQKLIVNQNSMQEKKLMPDKKVAERKQSPNILFKKPNKSFVEAPKKIKIKLDRASDGEVVPLKSYTSNMFDILATIDTNSNPEEAECTASDNVATAVTDSQKNDKCERKDTKKDNKKKLKLIKLEKQEQLKAKKAKEIERRKERRRRENLQSEIIILRKIAMDQLDVDHQKEEPKIESNPPIVQSPPGWCQQKFIMPKVICQAPIELDEQQPCSSATLSSSKMIRLDDSDSSEFEISFDDSTDSKLSSNINIRYRYWKVVPAVSKVKADIPSPYDQETAKKILQLIELRKKELEQQQTPNGEIHKKSIAEDNPKQELDGVVNRKNEKKSADIIMKP